MQNKSYVLRLLSIGVFRQYQYLKIYTTLLYSLVFVNGKLYNDSTLLKYQFIILYQNYYNLGELL
jgi:hypothetical protein